MKALVATVNAYEAARNATPSQQASVITGKGKGGVAIILGVLAAHLHAIALLDPHATIRLYKIIVKINKGLVTPHFNPFVYDVNLALGIAGVDHRIRELGLFLKITGLYRYLGGLLFFRLYNSNLCPRQGCRE